MAAGRRPSPVEVAAGGLLAFAEQRVVKPPPGLALDDLDADWSARSSTTLKMSAATAPAPATPRLAAIHSLLR